MLPGNEPGDDQGTNTRRALRQALRTASAAVDEAAGQLEGMQEAFGLHAGTEPGHSESLHDLDRLRQAYQLLAHNQMLQRIALLAGRLQRLGAAYKRKDAPINMSAPRWTQYSACRNPHMSTPLPDAETVRRGQRMQKEATSYIRRPPLHRRAKKEQPEYEAALAFATAWLQLSITGAWYYPDGRTYGPYADPAQRASIARSWAKDARQRQELALAQRLERLAATIEAETLPLFAWRKP